MATIFILTGTAVALYLSVKKVRALRTMHGLNNTATAKRSSSKKAVKVGDSIFYS